MPFSLEVLGGCDLRGEDGARAQSVLQQPRRLALLAYLALASRTAPVRRDTVVGVFWPDSSPSKARGSLSQALFYLRRSLGADPLLVGGNDELSLDEDCIACDARSMLNAFDQGEWQAAAEMYTGDLLPGFTVGNTAPDLEQWIERERSALRRTASEAAWHVSESAEAEGDGPRSALWARRAAGWSGGDEVYIRRLMSTLDRLGDRAGVLGAYQNLERELGLLDVAPSDETEALLSELLAGWGSSESVARESETGQQETAAAAATERRPAPAEAARVPRRRRTLVPAVLLVGLMVSAWGLGQRGRGPAEPVPSADVTLVLADLAMFGGEGGSAAALRTELARALTSAPGLRIVLGREAPQSGVAFILDGGVERDAEQIRVHAELLEAGTGVLVESTRLQRDSPGDPDTLESLAAELALFARRGIGRALSDAEAAPADVPVSATVLLRLGRDNRAHGDSLYAAGSFDVAEMAYRNGDSLLARATRLAPDWPAPVVHRAWNAHSLAWLKHRVSGPGEAVPVAREAIDRLTDLLRRDSTHIEARRTRATIGHWLWAVTMSDPPTDHARLLDRAEADARMVTELDPGNAEGWSLLGATTWARGDFGQSYWALTNAISSNTFLKGELGIAFRLFGAAWELDDRKAADRWCAKMHGLVPEGYLPAYCSLKLASISDNPDTASVTEILASSEALDLREVEMGILHALGAVSHARVGAMARARTILQQIPPQVMATDAGVQAYVAWAHLELGDEAYATTLVDELVDGSPDGAMSVVASRRFRRLPGD